MKKRWLKLWMHNYLNFPFVKVLVEEMLIKALETPKAASFVENFDNERSIFATQRC